MAESQNASLDVQARLEYARTAVSVLRSLKLTGQTMRYKHFAIAIGLICERGKWRPWHRQQITDILNLVAAVEHQARCANSDPLEFERVVDKDGQPGSGFHKVSRIITTDPTENSN